MKKHIALLCVALGSPTLFSGCAPPSSGEVSLGVGIVNAGNTAGAIIAGVVNPALVIPAGAVAGALNASNCQLAKQAGGSC